MAEREAFLLKLGIILCIGLATLLSAAITVAGFTISTDKSTYSFGETIQVSVVFAIADTET